MVQMFNMIPVRLFLNPAHDINTKCINTNDNDADNKNRRQQN